MRCLHLQQSASVKERGSRPVEDEIENSDRGNLATDVSGTLGVNITPHFTVEFLLAELGSSLSIYSSSLPV